ncbi:MAG: ATP-binding protein [Bacilli bacterium]
MLSKIGLVKNCKLTNAGHYLFSKNEPIVLKMAVFATDEKLTFLDINRISGNIFDLIDEAYTYIKRNILWKAEIAGFERVETPEIPLKALREIICNSFAHARYNSNTEHEITIHPSMVRIYNPGEFPIGYKPEDFVHENIPSKVRNPLILKTLFLSEDVESYSSGLKRVYSECEKNNINIDYVTGREGFTFIFKRNVVNSVINSVVNANLSVDEEMVINIIKANPNYSSETISKLINKSSRSVQRIIAELKKKGIIERIGGTRGYWKVNR